ncbi:MAG TPA: ATP-binding protein [Vicinamibacterales bacterium]|nr:ATP-binding protein [Vicinamibacterales bacterium]
MTTGEADAPVRVPATPAGLRVAAEALQAFGARAGWPAATTWQLHVALDEALSNIVRHGGSGEIDVSFRTDGKFAEMTVEDDGPPFDPLAHPAPDLRGALETRRPGGLGVALIRSLMDEVRYERTYRNVLVLRKRLAPGAARQETR